VSGNCSAPTDARVVELLELMPDRKSRRLFEAYYRGVRAGLAASVTDAPKQVPPAAVRTAMSFYDIGRPRSREELRVTGRHLPVQINTSTVEGASHDPH